MIRFDIIFYARVPERRKTSKGSFPESLQTAGTTQATESPQTASQMVQIIINVEAQKDEPKSYNILNRAIFYVCRLISSQKNRDFVKMNYNDIKRVYSIWVCLSVEECVLDHVHLQKDTLLNEYQWKGDLDLLNIVMVGLPKKLPEREEKYELHRLLYALLSSSLPVTRRLEIVQEECPTQMDDEMREELSEMCNLSQGVREEGREEGRAEGRKEGREEGRSTALLTTVRNLMDSMSLNAGEAMDAMKIPEEEREDIKNRLDGKAAR